MRLAMAIAIGALAGCSLLVDTSGLAVGDTVPDGAADGSDRTPSSAAHTIYCYGTEAPRYRSYRNGAISADASIFTAAPGTGAVEWMDLVVRPESDEITLLYSDANLALFAATWDGAAW